MINNARQYNIIEESKLNAVNLIVIGVGAGGGWATYFANKLGINNIRIYDFDNVESANIPAQIFRNIDIGERKIDTLFKMISECTGDVIEIRDERVNKDTNLDIGYNTIILNMVDNIETREILLQKIRGFPVLMIDCRMGGEGWSIYTVRGDVEKEISYYEDTLKGEFRLMPCGEQAVIYSTVNEVSECVNLIKRYINGQNIPLMIRRDMNDYQYIVKW